MYTLCPKWCMLDCFSFCAFAMSSPCKIPTCRKAIYPSDKVARGRPYGTMVRPSLYGYLPRNAHRSCRAPANAGKFFPVLLRNISSRLGSTLLWRERKRRYQEEALMRSATNPSATTYAGCRAWVDKVLLYRESGGSSASSARARGVGIHDVAASAVGVRASSETAV